MVSRRRVRRWVSLNPSARLALYDAGHELTECLGELFEEARRFLADLPALAAAHPGLLGQAIGNGQ